MASEKVKIGVLKNELSKYLRLVNEGVKVIVCDRNNPIAEIVPLSNSPQETWLEEQVKLGRITPGSKTGQGFYFPGIKRKIDKEKFRKILEEESDDHL